MIVMGRIVGAHGILGWVKVQTFTEYLDSLLDYDDWYMGDGKQPWRKVDILQANVHGKVLVARLQGVDDRSAAEKYKGMLVAVPREEFPDEDEDEYYWTDLIGMQVQTLSGEVLGTVKGLLETGANDVLDVRDAQGKSVLIPFIEQVVQEVDKEHKVIRADWQADY